MEKLKKLLISNNERLFYYSTYNFLREIDDEVHLEFIFHKFTPWLEKAVDHHIFKTEISNQSFYFLYQYLPWDSTYFNQTTFKLFTIISETQEFGLQQQAVHDFIKYLISKGTGYCFINIPAEDIAFIQALTSSSFRLTETRLTFYRDQLQNFKYQRFEVREATNADNSLIKDVAATCFNPFDRYHADINFSFEQANNYLATYAEACINGLAERVLIPNEEKDKMAAFMTFKNLQEDGQALNTKLAQLTLAAVSPICKGWFLKLAAENLQYAKSKHYQYVIFTTQATNRAVFRTPEKLGFKLGNTTHILALNF